MRILFMICIISFSMNSYAFTNAPEIAKLVEIINRLDTMIKKVDKNIRTLNRQRQIVENLSNIQHVRDISFDDIRNGNLTRMIRNLRSGINAIKENPFSSEIKDYKKIIDLLKQLKEMATLSDAEKELIDDEMKMLDTLSRIDTVEDVATNNLETSAKNNSERESSNITANNTSTLALIAIDEHKKKINQEMSQKKADKLAEEALTKIQSGILGSKKSDDE